MTDKRHRSLFLPVEVLIHHLSNSMLQPGFPGPSTNWEAL